MSVIGDRGHFFVQQEIFASAESEQAVRYMALALGCLDKSRALYFSFECPAVVNEQGGTLGVRPTCHFHFECADSNAYHQIMHKEQTPQMHHLLECLMSMNLQHTHVFYENVSCFQSIFTDVEDHLSVDELVQIRAVANVLTDDFTSVTDGFYLIPESYVYSSGNGDRRFQVHTTFWAKPEFETIAKKVARFISGMDARRALFFPFHCEDGGEMPAFLITTHFIDMEDYKNWLEIENNTPGIAQANKILATCCQSQTRQFWRRQMN